MFLENVSFIRRRAHARSLLFHCSRSLHDRSEGVGENSTKSRPINATLKYEQQSQIQITPETTYLTNKQQQQQQKTKNKNSSSSFRN